MNFMSNFMAQKTVCLFIKKFINMWSASYEGGVWMVRVTVSINENV